MNKDVIYIEPEDDITDILTEVKNSKAKIIALVPPKKAGVLKSAVNFKLLARTAREADKTIVLVTTDSALLKLAVVTKIPVAKTLQSKPEVLSGIAPEEEIRAEDSNVIEGKEGDVVPEDGKKTPAVKEKREADDEAIDLKEEEVEEKAEEDGKKKKSKKKSVVPNFNRFRKYIIMGIIGVVLIGGFLVWALVWAPSAKIMVSVRTTARPFSETISFTSDEGKADPEGGLFWMEEHKVTKQSSVEFTATGEVDKGSKATGTLTFKRTSASTTYQSAITIPKGTKFTRGDLSYITTEAGVLAALDNSNTHCEIVGSAILCTLTKDVTATVKVEAATGGTDYNIGATTSNWLPAGAGYSINGSEMKGGTTRLVKVVSAEDVTKAKTRLASENSSEGKAELLEGFPVGLIAISASFGVDTEEPVATPAIGEEAVDGEMPKLMAKTTFRMYGVDRVRIGEYIEARTKQAIAGEGDQVVYSTGVSDNTDENRAFIESFREASGVYTARLKTTTKIGPEVTDQMVKDKSLGRKIGEVQSLLKSINGISLVKVEASYFWVTSVPNDTNKVVIEITVE